MGVARSVENSHFNRKPIRLPAGRPAKQNALAVKRGTE
jgi:hypothetical protein